MLWCPCLQAGGNRDAQFVIPQDMTTGAYDVRLTAVDEAGHQARATLADALVVTE